ncbi:MAG: hypothetical protein HY394_04510 [Candidatus Diapherotrites archaeon]|nr:hypothetical protein [Candidatus Diapherotrites archaeon]
MEKVLKLTKDELKELEEEKKRNFEQRMQFIDLYVEWLKKKPNKAWAKGQNRLLSRAKAET